MWPPPDHWIRRDPRQVVTAGGVFHMPEGLEGAYGPMKDDERGSARGLLEYLIRFVNKLYIPVTPEDFQGGRVISRPIGQEQLRRLFHVAVHGPSTQGDPDLRQPSDDLLAEIRRKSARIQWAHLLERTETGARWSHHGFLPDVEPFFGFVTTLLMDAELRKDLGECQYRGCGNFFLSKGRNKLYCDEECMLHAHTQDSATRKNKGRARDALIKQGYGRERVHDAVEQAFRENPEAKARALARCAESRLRKGRAKG